uniref:site-specific DNA-methyltransferase (adenine-specific) n=1 Tax=Candidatus Kentrum eta TaxID=2126337 RepID=A0A450UTL3_9GAMM|nr:MAG: Methyltransferase domain-containing protein [Candidatus Kentron sp. H]VFJ95894.1 MAG: Methyltransferase domain-containing protein [Candidatus Kentron sp. H]VFK01944.1 MAG: Methyltransferase domain-containing protein [Candidatus Kentron sp. H]
MNTTEKTTLAQGRVAVPPEAIPPGMVFHDSLESVWEDVGASGYLAVIQRAWRGMGLHGVLCLDGRPVLYLREYDAPCASPERIRQHKLFWNQGVANVLVLVDPVSVYLYSGLVAPGDKTEEKALFEPIKQADSAQRIKTLFQQLATGRFYEIHRKDFDPKQSVDERLLGNLRDFRNKLIGKGRKSCATGLDIEEAHAFIGRILFLCYLLDRGIFNVGQPDKGDTGTAFFARELARRDKKERIEYLYGLFEELKDRFNGNMFDRDLDAEKARIQPDHLDELALFLAGGEIKKGQRAFWGYDFRMIPVEAISAIYQDFLAAEDKPSQRNTGAFYTPRFLAETVVDVAMDREPDAWDRSFLDPACGSGIFLVILFNRLAGRRLIGVDAEDYRARAEALRDILARQIRGVDMSETACRIACFSLYLAYLDFLDPPDIERYTRETGGKLPKLLHDPGNNEQPAADIPVIWKADSLVLDGNAFAGEEFPEGKFDCLVGNPPWEGRGKKQIAQRFALEAPRFLKDDGDGCLLLPTKLLHNKTDKFQAEWLSGITLEKVLQLADYSFLLFKDALCPAIIARFKNTAPDLNRHTVEFIAPKFNRDGLRNGVITIGPAARSWIRLADVIIATRSETAPVVWKQHLWGTRRDRKLLDLLQSLPPLSDRVDILSDVRKRGLAPTKGWIAGQGLKPWKIDKIPRESDPAPKRNHWPLDTPFMETKASEIDPVLSFSATIPFGKRLEKEKYRTDILYSSPRDNLFFCQKVLVTQGVSEGSIKAAYCGFTVLFQDSLQSIAGPEDDAELLMFLAAYLRSDLAQYFLFHTAANWGVERDKVHLDELLRLPFPLPGDELIAPDAAGIIEEVAGKVRKLGDDLQEEYERLKAEGPEQGDLFSEDRKDANKGIDTKKWQAARKEQTDALQAEIEPLIHEYFGLTDQEITVVEDTVGVFIPSATPNTWTASIPTLGPVEKAKVSPYGEQGLCAYGNTLANTLNAWAGDESSRYHVRAQIGADRETGLAMASLRLFEGEPEPEKICREESISPLLAETLKGYRETLSEEAGTLRYERDIFFFQGDRIHIIRPNILLNWTRTMALNDAAQIYGEILLRKRKTNAG